MERKGKKEEKRRKDEDLFKVVDSTLDSRTYYLLFQLNRKLHIKNIYGSISSGKEAKIYPAVTEEGKWYALKIYYVSTAASKRALERYTFGDPRFENIKVNNTRQLITVWARKEFKNLNRLYKNDVRVPQPIYVLENILVMQFLGEDGIRAPLLKEIPEEEINENLYKDILAQLENMVNKAELVHGDLSEYNIMVWEEKCYIIDVSQAIDISHPNAFELLRRDVENINSFFKSKGIEIIETEEILRRLKIFQNEDQN